MTNRLFARIQIPIALFAPKALDLLRVGRYLNRMTVQRSARSSRRAANTSPVQKPVDFRFAKPPTVPNSLNGERASQAGGV